MTLQVHQALYPRIAADPGMKFVYESIEMPASAVLGRIERHGVLIDSARLAEQSRMLAERMVALESEAYEIAGQPFNLGSPKQIGEILFGKLGLPVAKKTATRRAVAPTRSVLEKLALDYPLPAKLLEHRGLSKLKGTYTDKLPQMVNPADRPRAHALRAGGGDHRAAVQQRPQPAEHPDPHARGPARARGLRRAAGARDRVGRLLADRAAPDGPHQPGPGPAARVQRRHGRAPRDRGRGVQPARRRRSPASSAATPRPSTSA